MAVVTAALELHTRGDADIHDITAEVVDLLRQSGLQNGILTVFTPSSTSAITTIEYESGCLSDLRRLFDEIIPPAREYAHNTRWDDGNGHAHVRAALLGASFSVPFVNGAPLLGTWQQIIFVDFDNRPRHRRVVVQMVGE
ncbi:MAG: secondary thiamine-phosphate synthase enzyme YjbQ [Anaerolineales bacterium]